MRKIPLEHWVLVLGLLILWLLLGSKMLPSSRNHDFLNLYTGGSLALQGRFADMHDPAVQLAFERTLVPELPTLVPFVRPVFYSLLLAPLALLPYDTAFHTWILLQSLLLLAVWYWGYRRFGPDALVFAALFLPGPLGIASGQDCAILLLLLVLSFHLLERDRPAASGAILALMLMKFHLVLLWPVTLLLQRRWRMLAGFSLSAAALASVSLLLGGFQGALTYIHLLRNKDLDRLSPSPEFMICVQGLSANLSIDSLAFDAAVILAILVLYVIAIRKGPAWTTYPVTSLACLLIVPHVYAYDAAQLLLAGWLVMFTARAKLPRLTAAFYCSPIPFGFSLAEKPYSIIAFLSTAALFLAAVAESLGLLPAAPPRPTRAQKPASPPTSSPATPAAGPE